MDNPETRATLDIQDTGRINRREAEVAIKNGQSRDNSYILNDTVQALFVITGYTAISPTCSNMSEHVEQMRKVIRDVYCNHNKCYYL
jgi:uncharacterized protein YqfB (UPF0267 family)